MIEVEDVGNGNAVIRADEPVRVEMTGFGTAFVYRGAEGHPAQEPAYFVRAYPFEAGADIHQMEG